jgi:translation initiation factor 1
MTVTRTAIYGGLRQKWQYITRAAIPGATIFERIHLMKNVSKGGLVYSTEVGRTCSACRLALADCACQARAKAAPVGDGMVRVSLQSKGRGGKRATLVKGLALDSVALTLLGKQLRTACGCGGTVKDGVIEVQGDHRELVIEALAKGGHRAKLVGG